MATRYIIDIHHTDDLQTVIKKCNRNFKVIVGQQSKLDQIEANDTSDAVSNIVSGAVGEAVDSLNSTIASEANARRQADQDIQRSISDLRDDLPDEISDAILNAHPVNSAYTTFGSENPGTIIGGTWTMVDSISIGSESLKVWNRTH